MTREPHTARDCVWFEVLACDAEPPCMCGAYVSACGDEGKRLYAEYEADVTAALAPVERKWTARLRECNGC